MSLKKTFCGTLQMDPQNNFPYDIIDLGTYLKVGCRLVTPAVGHCAVSKMTKKHFESNGGGF